MLDKQLKAAATAAFRDNQRRDQMTPEEREAAAQFYERLAEQTVGSFAELARRYNLERARFLRGEADRIAPTARQFAREIGYEVE